MDPELHAIPFDAFAIAFAHRRELIVVFASAEVDVEQLRISLIEFYLCHSIYREILAVIGAVADAAAVDFVHLMFLLSPFGNVYSFHSTFELIWTKNYK